jgi:hypothetical protein
MLHEQRTGERIQTTKRSITLRFTLKLQSDTTQNGQYLDRLGFPVFAHRANQRADRARQRIRSRIHAIGHLDLVAECDRVRVGHACVRGWVRVKDGTILRGRNNDK